MRCPVAQALITLHVEVAETSDIRAIKQGKWEFVKSIALPFVNLASPLCRETGEGR